MAKVCMVPRASAGPEVLQWRRELFNRGGVTCHAPHVQRWHRESGPLPPPLDERMAAVL